MASMEIIFVYRIVGPFSYQIRSMLYRPPEISNIAIQIVDSLTAIEGERSPQQDSTGPEKRLNIVCDITKAQPN